MGGEKRQRLEESFAVGQRIADSSALLMRLQDVYGPLSEDFLWDTDKFQRLIFPRIGLTGENVSSEYTYVGRENAKPLYKLVCQLTRGNVLLIQGAKGSGKSTVMSSIVSFLLVKQKKRIVYFTALEFCHCPADVLRDALLVATGGCEQIAELTTMTGLSFWCERQRTSSDQERLLFVVDDWDRFGSYPLEESSLVAITRYHILIKLSSTSSRNRQLTSTSDKPMPCFDFDGPYSEAELQTWISQSTLPEDKLEDLDCLTGGMPQLLRFYEEAGGNAHRFQEMIAEKYTDKLYEKLVKPQTTSAELAALVRLVTTGRREVFVAPPFDFTCFYKDGPRLTLLSPFLRSRLEFYIMEHKPGLYLKDIQHWSDVVRLDCISSKGRNSARVGWNVEGLSIAVMRHQGKLWGDLDFELVKTYEHGCEAALLASLTDEKLSEGVLVVPIAFKQQALDVIYLRLSDNTLEVKPVQITVSAGKHKKKKQSHIVWQTKVLPKWLAKNFVVKHQFAYLMPGSLTKEELGDVNSDLRSYLELCRATGPGPDRDPDPIEVSEVYDEETSSLDRVISEEVLFKTFGDVHVCLKEFDKKLLRVAEPRQSPKKEESKQCTGIVMQGGSLRPCKRWCRTNQAIWFCCPGHAPSSV